VIEVWITVFFVISLLLGATFLASRNFRPKSSELGKFERVGNLKDIKIYQCPACNHKFTEADEGWYSILRLESCPSCGKSLPDNVLDKFCCSSCGKIKDIKELGSINRVARFVLNSLPAPRLEKICNQCRHSANFLGWFFLIMAVFVVVSFLSGNHAP
jgi:predicted RNA-binding Zn-ribbon protein involved in translation (DUF1610 family)